MTRKSWFLSILIVILAGILRLSFLADFPTGFTADEAAQGYTAYSVLKTGKDEWGKFLPLNPRSFGDFKPPLYTYLTVPSIAIFGLNEFAVRLPAVVFGTLAVLMTFLVVKELFQNSLTTYYLPLLSSFFLAISPWHISLSRAAVEANLTTFFLPLGFYFFLKGLTHRKFLFPAAFVFGLNLFTYHSARLLTPIFLIFLIWWKRKELLGRFGKEEKIAVLIFSLFLSLTVASFWLGGGTRIQDIGIQSAGFWAPKRFIDNYLSYFSLEFLFLQGAGDATYGVTPGRGLLYLFELPFLVFAFISLVNKWGNKFFPILVWIFLAPLPAALTLGVGYHANRVAIMMPAIQILSAYGAIVSFSYLKKWFPKLILLLFYPSTLLLFLASFLWSYSHEAPKISAPAMSYGWREAMDYITTIENKYPKIIVSRRFSEPQIFVAFYKKWGPVDFQKESVDWLRYQKEGLKFVDQLGTYNLGNYEFRNINWNEDKNLKNVLFVGKEDDFPQNESLTKRIIPYPDGKPSFTIVARP